MTDIGVYPGDGVTYGPLMSLDGLTGPFKLTNEGQPAVSVTFGQGSYFEGSAVVPTLVQLAQLTIRTIETSEQAYFGTAL